MAHDGLGVGVLVVGIGVVDTLFHQVAEATVAEYIGETPRQVASQGIDSDLQYQSRLFSRPGGTSNYDQGRQNNHTGH